VYVDKKDKDDKPWTGIKILLLQDNTVINEGLTPALFEDLPKGTYVVREVVPAGYIAIGPTEYEFTILDEHLFHNFTFGPFVLSEPIFHRNHHAIQNTNINNFSPSSKRKRIPSWNISGRPKKPIVGSIGFNIDTNNLEVWDGNVWFLLPMKKM
jgi:hypothetical protein